MAATAALHLTYCTNIHPAVGWEAVLDSLRAHAPALKARLSPDAPFGIGLRLSGAESAELLEGDRLARFRAWLDAEGLYVFTINGFPHGTFHGQPVKADVHAPDWRTEERVAYTLRLAEILVGAAARRRQTARSPRTRCRTDRGSTMTRRPGSCARRTSSASAKALRGTRIALAIEPEADGALADIGDLVRWWAERPRPRPRDGLLRRLPLGRRLRGARRRRSTRSTTPGSASARRSSAPRCGCRSRRAPELRAIRRPDLPAPGDAAQRGRLAAIVAGPAGGAVRERRRRGVARALPRADLRRALRRARVDAGPPAGRDRSRARPHRRTWRSRPTPGTCCRPT